ncbi:uncharacterized protein LOC127285261 [Leptopilina boulardi]|uniref:uncharacterized protein LOC127285261 n=1 Tax=Leptopilina boulardi TaxID=63433 RepID=UPI0021F55548|nr:uncharacterized protein LOC127285261 [Leptopilina boulardi]
MISLIFIKLLLIFVSSTISQNTLQWNLNMTTRIAVPLVREFSEPWTSHTIQNQFSHYKTHFEIIIKRNTTFNLTLETSSQIQNLYFYCLADSPYETLNILDLTGKENFTKTLTANFDCVPMISVSNNVPVRMIIETKNWLSLPIFDSNDASLFESQEFEFEFYKNVQIYGFVENYYTQMLLSVNDIDTLKSLKYSLYLGLENQIDIIEYYDYLTGFSPFNSKNIVPSLKLIDRSTLFIRSEKCDKYTLNLNTHTCPETNMNLHFISAINNLDRFLQPQKGFSWILLEKFAEYYNRKENAVDFGETFKLWNDMFATLYQQKFVMKNPMLQSASPYKYEKISNYQKGIYFTEWGYEEKLNLFISLFGYDGTDTNLREFRIRHIPYNQITTDDSVELIPTILELFLDLYDINLLPFLKKVIKDISLSPELELRVLNGHPVMPAIDFGINAKNLPTMSYERDLRKISPLMLVTKMKKTYVNVTFTIESTIDLTNSCLYLNNDCHNIVGKQVNIKLLSDVYSVYVVEEILGNTYISDVKYHTISQTTFINVEVREIQKGKTYFPLLHYRFDAQGLDNKVFLQTFINYKDMKLSLKQLTNAIYDENEYFSLNLKRNGSTVMKYKFPNKSQNQQLLTNDVLKFEVNDELLIYHREPKRLKFNLEGYNNSIAQNNIFLFTNVGLDKISKKIENLKYSFDVLGLSHRKFLKIIINYETMTISLEQLLKDAHKYFKGELYFSISLERNDSSIFEYKLNGTQENKKPLINVKHKLIVNDKIHIFHNEPSRLWLHSKKYNTVKHNTFVVTNEGLLPNNDLSNKIISADIKRIDKFNSEYNIDLSYNALYQYYFANYIRTLRVNDLQVYMPLNWL